MALPIWDGAVYLENANNWLSGTPLYESFRPPLISWLIAGIWAATDVNDWTMIRYLQAPFTIGSGIILYMTLRRHKGSAFAFGVGSLTMLNTQVFYNSSLILTEGLSLFFLTLTLYFSKLKDVGKRMPSLGAGISLALTFAARYPIVVQALAIIAIEALIRKNERFFAKAMLVAVPLIAIVVILVFLKAGSFSMALEADAGFTILLSPYYVINSTQIWGYAVLLVPAVFIFKRTFEDRYNYTFIVWFIVGLLFWSSNISNHQERFGIQFTPAVYFLAMLTIENIMKSKLVSPKLRLKDL
jgi:hypothetical protein